MRKRRAIIFDDEDFVLNMLEDVFQMRNYEVFGFKDASNICPMHGRSTADCGTFPCADVLLTDFHMPGMSGLELLRRQTARGCSLDNRNKGVISGNIDGSSLRQIEEMGCSFFQKPFSIQSLLAWIEQCEARVDISRPLVTRRREERYDRRGEVALRLAGSDEILSTVAVNVSGSGLCVEVPALLKREETLSIVKAPLTMVCSQASVRWVRQTVNGSCLAGLLCS